MKEERRIADASRGSEASSNYPGTNPAASRPKEPFSPPEGPPDRELVARVLGGETEVYRVLVERYQRKVFGMAMGYLGGRRERAEDCAQEIFLKIYRGLRSFQENALFSTWLHRIAANHLISEIRKERALKRGRPLSLDAPLHNKRHDEFGMQVGNTKEEPVARLQNEERGKGILQAIEGLDEELRSIVVLRDLQDHSYESIAEMLEIPIGTVRSRLHRARDLLRAKLKEYL